MLLRARYRLTSLKTTPPEAVIQATMKLQLRSRTTALGHKTLHQGQGEVTATYTLDLKTGLPVRAKAQLKASYQQRANDRKSKTSEELSVTLDRAPSAAP